jgi:3-hydroxy-5-methyl-1-naphthoate 3-O-methyltransferase
VAAAGVRIEPPTVDDRAIWDLWLSQYQLPVVLVADELGLFGLLHAKPSDQAEICAQLSLSPRSAEALLAVLAASGFVVKRQARFHLTNVSRTYLLKDSEFYWVPMLRGTGRGQLGADALMDVLRTDQLDYDARISRRWERGEMTLEEARGSNQRMHSHSWPAALGLARGGAFSTVRRLLDVAGGSGCFSIALALQYPTLRCTVAELPVVAADTRRYIERYGCEDRVDTHPFNMFRDPWPEGYDAIFFSNVFHDWDPDRRDELTSRTFSALPPGGRIYLHEMLLDDAHDGPLPPALFSVMMLGTRGKQFSAAELADKLTRAGFVDPSATHNYGYYSLVCASKPRLAG